MRTAVIGCLLCGLAALPAAAQRQWEVGAAANTGLYRNNAVEAASASGDVGFKSGAGGGLWLGHNSSDVFSGELRYFFQKNDMRVASSGAEATFAGWSHAFGYDVLVHTAGRAERVRPYLAAGAGLKGYIGTGVERAFQPLSHLAILSKTTEWKPMVNVGGGVKWLVSPNATLRVEVRDYITQFPADVILPAPGARVKGWVHGITPMFGVSYAFQ